MSQLQLVVDSVPMAAMDVSEPLVRAVIISLFTWRRAAADDVSPNGDKFGWWGDSFPAVTGDQIGSRLWLLSRAKLTTETISRAKGYALEALQWLIDQGVAGGVDVVVERPNLFQLSLGVTVTRGDGSSLNIRFADAWSFLNAV